MKMLHKLLPEQRPETKAICEKFMSGLQPEYPKKISVEYARPGNEAIPMPMYSGEPIAMGQADVYSEPIVMQEQDSNTVVEEENKEKP